VVFASQNQIKEGNEFGKPYQPANRISTKMSQAISLSIDKGAEKMIKFLSLT